MSSPEKPENINPEGPDEVSGEGLKSIAEMSPDELDRELRERVQYEADKDATVYEIDGEEYVAASVKGDVGAPDAETVFRRGDEEFVVAGDSGDGGEGARRGDVELPEVLGGNDQKGEAGSSGEKEDLSTKKDIDDMTRTEGGEIETREHHELSEHVLASYDVMKISKEDLEGMEGFTELSEGQQLMVLENLKQVAVGRVHEDAEDAHAEAYAERMRDSNFLGKIWNGMKENLGGKQVDTARKVKLLASGIMEGGINMHRETMAALVSGMRESGPDVKIGEGGALEVQYAGRIENLDEGEQGIVDRFNDIATQYGKIPYEWSLPTASKEEQQRYKDIQRDYEGLKSQLFRLKERKSEDPAEVCEYMAKTENTLQMNQFLNTNPDVEEELMNLHDQSALHYALANSIGKVNEKAVYMGMGYIGRTVLTGAIGWVAAPVVASAMGGMTGAKRANERIIEMEKLGRRGQHAQNEQEQKIERNFVAAQGENGLEAKLDDLLDSVEHYEHYEGKMKARTGKESIENLKSRPELVSSLKARIYYTERKIVEGLVDFGDKDSRLEGQYEMMKTLVRARGMVDMLQSGEKGKKLNERLDNVLNIREGKIDKEEKKYVRRKIRNGALMGAGFAGAGAATAELIGTSEAFQNTVPEAIVDRVNAVSGVANDKIEMVSGMAAAAKDELMTEGEGTWWGQTMENLGDLYDQAVAMKDELVHFEQGGFAGLFGSADESTVTDSMPSETGIVDTPEGSTFAVDEAPQSIVGEVDSGHVGGVLTAQEEAMPSPMFDSEVEHLSNYERITTVFVEKQVGRTPTYDELQAVIKLEGQDDKLNALVAAMKEQPLSSEQVQTYVDAGPVTETGTEEIEPVSEGGSEVQTDEAGTTGGNTEEVDTTGATQEATSETGQVATTVPVAETDYVNAAGKIEHTVEGGDNLWNVIKRRLEQSGNLEGMDEGQQTYVIDAIKDKFAAMSPEELKAIGISSGNIDQLTPGDTLDLTSVLGDTQEIPNVLANAEGLSAEAIQNIEANNEVISQWAAEHPGEALTEAKINEILHPEPVTAPVQPADGVVDSTEGAAGESISPQEEMGKIEMAKARILAKEQVSADVERLYGGGGIFGGEMLSGKGTDSVAWSDLKGRSVDDILARSEYPEVKDALGPEGFDDPEVVEKTQKYIQGLVMRTELAPEPGETLEDYMYRANEWLKMNTDYGKIERSEPFVTDIHGGGAEVDTSMPSQGEPEVIDISVHQEVGGKDVDTRTILDNMDAAAEKAPVEEVMNIGEGNVSYEGPEGKLAAHFDYDDSGNIKGFRMDRETLPGGHPALYNSVLKEGWQQTGEHLSPFNYTTIEAEAADLGALKKLMEGMEAEGAAGSPEYSSIKKVFEFRVRMLERQYGDIAQ